MKPKKRQKLCHNCEGEIDIDVIVCPFCAADLREEKPEQKSPPFNTAVRNLSGQSSGEGLYPSPTHMKRSEPVEDVVEEESTDVLVETPEKKEKNFFAPTILFTLGVQLFLFGLMMLLFSHKGVVILKWDAHYWWFYVGGALPFLYVGYKALTKLED